MCRSEISAASVYIQTGSKLIFFRVVATVDRVNNDHDENFYSHDGKFWFGSLASRRQGWCTKRTRLIGRLSEPLSRGNRVNCGTDTHSA